MLGAYKKHPQAYLMYVEDCFLLSDNADARLFAKNFWGGVVYIFFLFCLVVFEEKPNFFSNKITFSTIVIIIG